MSTDSQVNQEDSEDSKIVDWSDNNDFIDKD